MCAHHCDYEGELKEIFEEVKNTAYKIIEAKDSTYYAIALALVKISESMLRNENSILPVSALINDYYGINDVCISIRSQVNRNGIKKFLRLELSDQEREQFKHSASTLKEIIKTIKF